MYLTKSLSPLSGDGTFAKIGCCWDGDWYLLKAHFVMVNKINWWNSIFGAVPYELLSGIFSMAILASGVSGKIISSLVILRVEEWQKTRGESSVVVFIHSLHKAGYKGLGTSWEGKHKLLWTPCKKTSIFYGSMMKYWQLWWPIPCWIQINVCIYIYIYHIYLFLNTFVWLKNWWPIADSFFKGCVLSVLKGGLPTFAAHCSPRHHGQQHHRVGGYVGGPCCFFVCCRYKIIRVTQVTYIRGH